MDIDIPPAVYYSYPYRALGTIAATLVLTVGLTGNILVITVIMWSSKMWSPTNCYLVSLSFSDLLFLLHATVPYTYELYFIVKQWKFGDTACRIMTTMQYLSVDISVVSMAAFSIERWVAICHPMRAQTLCTVNRALKIIAGIWISCLAYNSVWFFIVLTEARTSRLGNYTVCTYRFDRHKYIIVYLLDLILFYTIPLCLIFTLYMQITSRLFTFHKPVWLTLNKGKSDAERETCKGLSRQENTHSIINTTEGGANGLSGRTGYRQGRSRRQVRALIYTIIVLLI